MTLQFSDFDTVANKVAQRATSQATFDFTVVPSKHDSVFYLVDDQSRLHGIGTYSNMVDLAFACASEPGYRHHSDPTPTH